MNKNLILKYKKEFGHYLINGECMALYTKKPNKWLGEKNEFTSIDGTDSIWEHAIANNLSTDDIKIVIDDRFVKYRQALVEGKIVELLVSVNSFPIIIRDEEDYKVCADLMYPHDIKYPYTIKKVLGGVKIHHFEDEKETPSKAIEAKDSNGKFIMEEETLKISNTHVFSSNNRYIIKEEGRELYFNIGDWVISKEYGLIEITKDNVDSYNKNLNDLLDPNSPVFTRHWTPSKGEVCWFFNKDDAVMTLGVYETLILGTAYVDHDSGKCFEYCKPCVLII